MKKAPEAFRTISEVAELLQTPAHVLRFWESKFYQIRPVKRAGGRRYYRPDDVALINGIRVLLQDRGMTIRGAQRILQEQGVKAVVATGLPLPLERESDDVERMEAEGDNAAAETLLPEFIARDDPIDLREIDDAVLADELDPMPAYDEAAPIPDGVLDPSQWGESAPLARSEAPASALDALCGADVPVEDAGDVAPFDDASDISADSLPVSTDVTPELITAKASDDATKPTLAAKSRTAVDDTVFAPSPVPLPASAQPSATYDTVAQPDRVRLARALRAMPRGAPAPQRDRMALLARRIDALLERMSEASGAGRW